MIVNGLPEYSPSDPRYEDVAALWLGLQGNKWIPQSPTEKQLRFLLCPEREALYGGAGGGGKSSCLLMGALQFVNVPGYSAILFRKTYKDLARPEALMTRAREWLANTAAHWNEDKKTWTFPSTATLSFGHLENENDKSNYKGGAYHYIGFDEATDIPITRMNFLLSRLRRLKGCPIPLRARYATNPGGPAHAALYERFVVGKYPFFPAMLDDNPFIDKEDYVKSLELLDDVTRSQILHGMWITDARGRPFRIGWWRGKNRYDAHKTPQHGEIIGRFVSWDTAQKGEDINAYTARVVVELDSNYRARVRDVWKERIQGADVPATIEMDAHRWNYDGKLAGVIIEDRSTGTTAIQMLNRIEWIAPLIMPFEPQPFGDKLFERPQRASIWCKRGCVLLPFPSKDVPWLFEFETALDMWPDVQFFDDVDAFNQCIIYLEHFLDAGWQSRGALDAA